MDSLKASDYSPPELAKSYSLNSVEVCIKNLADIEFVWLQAQSIVVLYIPAYFEDAQR